MAANNNNSKIWQDAVSATSECPGIEMLEQVMEGTAKDPKTQNHVSTCPHCQQELAMLRKFEHGEASADEGAAVAWIAAQLQRNQKEAAKPAGRVNSLLALHVSSSLYGRGCRGDCRHYARHFALRI